MRNRYRDLREDSERLHAFERSASETPFDRVEYADAGDGPSVLVVRGVFGGYDFGVGTGRSNVPPGYRIIAPSRFGYFGSPFPVDPSPAAQADAFAALLDHLRIDALPVAAFSAGSSSTVRFALRHPERVSRLVLISPNAPHPQPLPKPPRPLAPILFSQPVFWAMRLLARSRLEGMSGTPRGFVPDEREHAALGRSSTACSRSVRAHPERSTTATSATSTPRAIRSSRSPCPRSLSLPKTTRWRRIKLRAQHRGEPSRPRKCRPGVADRRRPNR